jgi:hypothetical protein
MKLRTALKIIAAAALLMNILATILLFGSIRNTTAASDQGMLLPYLCIFGILLFSFVLFLLFMVSETGTEVNTGKSAVKAEIKEETEIRNTGDTSERAIDINELKKKAVEFIPLKEAAQNYTLKEFAEGSLSAIAKVFPITEGIFYIREKDSDQFTPLGDYAYFSEKPPGRFKLGETLPGQVAKNKYAMNLSEIPEDYVKVASGLGQGKPRHLYFLPVLNNDETIAVIEMASFKEFDKETEKLFELGAQELSQALVKAQSRNL